MRQKGEEALATFKELAAEASDQMRPVMVEFLFDGDKAVFYFESEERIDFRDLVRKLASVFHVRVDMRQIGVRDGARMIGGLGHCGQELCCARMGGDFLWYPSVWQRSKIFPLIRKKSLVAVAD